MYPTLTPHLAVRHADQPIDFYVQAFGAVEVQRFTMPDCAVVHAELRMGDALCTLGEAMAEYQQEAPVPSGLCRWPHLVLPRCRRHLCPGCGRGGRRRQRTGRPVPRRPHRHAALPVRSPLSWPPTRAGLDLSVAPPDFARSESPRYFGRAVAALATDGARSRWNQRSVDSGQLAAEYGCTDLDGSQPDIWRSIFGRV